MVASITAQKTERQVTNVNAGEGKMWLYLEINTRDKSIKWNGWSRNEGSMKDQIDVFK